MICDSDWKTCSDDGSPCASDGDCTAGTCSATPTCVTPVTVTARDLGGLTSTSTYKSVRQGYRNLTLSFGPGKIEVLNATPAPSSGTDYDAGRRCAVPADVVANPQNYIKDYNPSTMTVSNQGTWVRIRQPELRGLCDVVNSQVTTDHGYPKTKTSGFMSSDTEDAEKRLTLCMPHNTNGSGPVALTSLVKWEVTDDNSSSVRAQETLEVSVYNSGYLILLTDYTGKRPEDSVFLKGDSDATRPFIKSHVCQQLGESPCGASLVTANNWTNDGNYSSNGIQWKIADGDPSMAPYWSQKDDSNASYHATFDKENIYCPMSITADIDTTAGTLKAFGRLSSFSADGTLVTGDYPCFGIDRTKPAHSFTMAQKWYPEDNAKSAARIDTNPLVKATYPHHFIGNPLPIDIASTDQGGVYNAGIEKVQLIWTDVDTDTTVTLLDGDCAADPFYLTGPSGVNPLSGDCLGNVTCPNKPEACVTDPFTNKLSLNLEALGRGHHKLQIRLLDRAGTEAENDFYLELVDMPTQMATWSGWLQGYINRSDGNNVALAAVDDALIT